MTVLVTGASGIVGRALVSHLHRQGLEIIGLCRNPPGNRSEDLHWLQGDVSMTRLGLDPKTWQTLCRTVTAIFHLAARTDFKGSSLDDYRPVNIDGVDHVKTFALASGAWLHHVSTAFVCGNWKGEFREEQLDGGQTFHNFYEQSKYLGECLLRKKPTPRFTVYRPAIIIERRPETANTSGFGPFAFLDGVFRLCLRSAKRNGSEKTIRVEGDAGAHLPLVFDDDIAGVIATLAADQLIDGQTYHLTPAAPLPNRLLEQVFNRAFSRQAATWVDGATLQKDITSLEKILAKKTRAYTPYLDLSLTFARNNLDAALGNDVLPAIDEDELLASFATFLATKKKLCSIDDSDEKLRLESYFTKFLRHFIGKRLIENLASLSTRLYIDIKGQQSWSITIEKGVLIEVTPGSHGDFGYITDSTTFLQVASGQLSPQQGFFQGGIRLADNPKEALKTASALEEFFHSYPFEDNEPEHNGATDA